MCRQRSGKGLPLFRANVRIILLMLRNVWQPARTGGPPSNECLWSRCYLLSAGFIFTGLTCSTIFVPGGSLKRLSSKTWTWTLSIKS